MNEPCNNQSALSLLRLSLVLICTASFLCVALMYHLCMTIVLMNELELVMNGYRNSRNIFDMLVKDGIECMTCKTYQWSQKEQALFDCDHVQSYDQSLLDSESKVLQQPVLKNQQMEYLLSSVDYKIGTDELKRRAPQRGLKKGASRVFNFETNQQKYPCVSNERLRWPIAQGKFWLSSFFGPRRKWNGTIGFHYGIDMAAVKGTEVIAAADGVVVEARYKKGFGNAILLRHADQVMTRYAHLHSVSVKQGDLVVAGACIGKVGETGHIRKTTKDGSHLHFEVFYVNRRVNPLRWLALKKQRKI